MVSTQDCNLEYVSRLRLRLWWDTLFRDREEGMRNALVCTGLSSKGSPGRTSIIPDAEATVVTTPWKGERGAKEQVGRGRCKIQIS